MISGKRLVPILILLGLEALSVGAQAAAIPTLISSLKREPPVHEAFVEYRFSRFTKKPAQSRGELQYLGPDHLVRLVETPRPEKSTIRNGMIEIERPKQSTKQYALKRVPALQALLGSITGLLGGDLAVLEQRFALTLEGTEAGFRLTLTPKEPAMQKRLSRIDVLGRERSVHCLAFVEPDAEQSWLVLGARVAKPDTASPSIDTFTELCQGP